MFERFTSRARSTVVLAQDEARRLRHNYIGTEHVLLGLIREPEGLAAQALNGLGVSLEAVRREVLEIIGEGAEKPKGHIPFTPRAKKALELSLREAMNLNHNYIGTEHILLGVVREAEGVAAQVLVNLGADLDQVRQEVVGLLESTGAGSGVPDVPGRAAAHRTPAAAQAVEAAGELAGGSPTGSHHLLEALARAEGSAAAKVLASLGVDPEALAAKIDEVGIEETTDLTPEESAARRVEIRRSGDGVEVVLRDETAVATADALIEELGGPARGDDPAVGGLVGLHQGILRELAALLRRLRPAPEDEEDESAATGDRPNLLQRAIRSRLRRRGR